MVAFSPRCRIASAPGRAACAGDDVIHTLHRKLAREMLRLKGQIATIALVLASGIVCFISMRGTYASLADAQVAYYDRFRFAHVFASAERVPETVARKLEAIAGVATLETRVAED